MFQRCHRPEGTSPKQRTCSFSYEFLEQGRCSFSLYNSNGIVDKSSKYMLNPSTKLPIPEGCQGCFRSFVSPEVWSCAFSSPGDFTVKLYESKCIRGEVVHRIGVLSGWLSDANGCVTRGHEFKRTGTYVVYIDRRDFDFKRLLDSLSL